MKKFLQILVTAALAVMPAGAFADNDNPCFGWVGYSADSKVSGAPVKGALFDGEMPCDDSRTVYDQGIDVYYGGNKGFVKSDRSLCAFRGKYYRSRAFSHFSNNQCPIDGIRIYAFFVNSDYSFSNVEELTKRFNLDENGKMKTPMKLTVTFCDDANGYPGTVLYKKTFEVYGKKSEGVVGDPDRGEVQSPIYCFDIELGEKLRIESAWFSVYAEDTGEKQERPSPSSATPRRRTAPSSTCRRKARLTRLWHRAVLTTSASPATFRRLSWRKA